MTLRNFIDMLTNPYSIDTIYAVDTDGYMTPISYCHEESIEEYRENYRNSESKYFRITEEEIDMYCVNYRNYRNHLDSEIIKIELANGDSGTYIYVKCNEDCIEYCDDYEDEEDEES